MVRRMPDDPYWCVARTINQHEALAEARLVAAGFETSAPRTPQGPLFRNYLFVRIESQWRVVATTIGIMCLIRFGDEGPARCPEAEIERLRAMVDPGTGLIKLPDKVLPGARRAFKKGEKIRIIGGPFEGVAALHSGMRAADREIALLAVLGAQRRIAVPAYLVHAAQ
jgi:transcriptional antiterminator RfaH